MPEPVLSKDDAIILALMELYRPQLEFATERSDDKTKLWEGILMGFAGIACSYTDQPTTMKMLQAVIEMLKHRPPDVSKLTH